MTKSHDIAPAAYYPFRGGQYKVAAGLYALGQDFGNGLQDRLVFQFDREWPDYREAKLAARAESLTKYVCSAGFDGPLKREVTLWLINNLSHQHHAQFEPHSSPGELSLGCRLSHETLHFSPDGDLRRADTGSHACAIDPLYSDAWDALACQVQEDIAVVHAPTDGEEKLVALHLCFPNHWAAQDKIGKPFLNIHRPVADFDHIARSSGALLRNAINKGPFVRFAWGLATDTRLNHHPHPPADFPADGAWHGRHFDPTQPELYVRVERQTLTGLPQVDAFVFTIRTYFINVATLGNDDRRALRDAVASMSEAVLRYKGIDRYRDKVIAWLNDGATTQ